MKEKKTILIVDDDSDFVDCIRMLLEGAGFEVDSASSAKECMLALQSKTPDLILLDIMMETLVSGLHVGYDLRTNPKFKHIPIVMLSAITEETGFDVAAEKDSEYVAADEFLNKPVKPAELLATVNRLLEERPARGGGD